MKFEKHYTVYSSETGELLAKGNLEEASSQLKIKPQSFKVVVNNVRLGRNKKYKIEVEKDPNYRKTGYHEWQLCQQIINAVRYTKGLPLRDNENPYVTRESRKVKG